MDGEEIQKIAEERFAGPMIAEKIRKEFIVMYTTQQYLIKAVEELLAINVGLVSQLKTQGDV